MIFAKSRLHAVLFIFSFALFSSAAAAEEGISTLKLDPPKVETKKEKKDYQAQMSGGLSVENAQYQSSIPGKPELDHSTLLTVSLKPQLKTENTQSLLSFTAEKYTDWGASNYTVRELYWDRSFRDNKSHVTVGRKVEFWSQLDADWKLSLWQPNAVLDSLRPENQGLTGLFYKHQQGRFEFLGLASPIFVPTQGPNVKEEDGNIVADSRWYRSPSSTFVLFNQQRRVVYKLNLPEMQELAKKPGFGFRMSYGRDSQGLWGSANFGYKPMNMLVVKYDRKLKLSEEGQDTGSAPLFPDVTYHSLWGADLGYKFSGSQLVFSYLEDRPINKAPDDPYIIQYANPMKGYAVHADSELKVPGFLNPVVLTLGYLRIDGGDYHDYDHEGTSQGAVFNQRFNFYNAASAELGFKTTLYRKKTVTRVTYLREFEQKGMIGSAAVDFYPISSMALTVGADVLGVDDSSDNNTDNGFLNQYRANDRIYAGVSYVF